MNLIKRLSPLAVSGLLISSFANAQESRTRNDFQVTPSAVMQPSNVELINKMLNPGPSDPTVPMPRAGLGTQRTIDDPSVQTPAFYGRKEENGVLLGLRVPIPADRANQATR